MEKNIQLFKDFLESGSEMERYATDDIISFVLPLFKEVVSFHEMDLVAPFEKEEALFITDHCLDIDEKLAHEPFFQLSRVSELVETKSTFFDIVGKVKMDTDVDSGRLTLNNLNVHLNIQEPLLNPAYIKGYKCFEQLLGHHDAQTDVFCLGLILGSISLALDLYDEEDVKLFAQYRTNPVQYNGRLHPTISALITEMTELDRRKRTPDLYDVIHRLINYRDYDPEKQTDLSTVAGWMHKELKGKSQFILNKLRNRLFDTSRRNRLLYYKPNMRFVNMTASSVPVVLHYQSIRPELLFTWNKEISGKIKGMNEIVLNKYLRFEDHPYLPSVLDKIRVESQRDVQEYGFSQLKLVIAFLNWHNLKEDTGERIQSPLLLIPVELKKNKKLKEDHYVLNVLANEAEVNPVLANHLRDLYGIKLPDFIDLDEMSLEQFYALLKEQIEGANQGISLNYIDKPRIKLIQSVARQTISNYKKRLRRGTGKFDTYKNLSYSYQTESYKPLGLEIFRQRIEPRSTFLEFLINDDINLASNQLTGTKKRELFEMVESENNPYSWDFDVCNIVLGNFNYKKMSLVRDYNEVIESGINHNVFEELFSSEPRKQSAHTFNLKNLSDWNHVITADPTQTKAILQSRTGESYIIQGPPGTGKSQTITNLIADFVAQGKKVLFVCEKRAALDVVYYRLKQQGLDELCCYIHDSQSDKREFIQNLKATYEDFVKNKMDLAAIAAKRTQLLDTMLAQLGMIEKFHQAHLDTHELAANEIRQLIHQLIDLKDFLRSFPSKDEELIPHYKYWDAFGTIVTELGEALEESGAEAVFQEHPFSKINEAVFVSDQPHSLLDRLLTEAQEYLKLLAAGIQQHNIEERYTSFHVMKIMAEASVKLQPLNEYGNFYLLDVSHPDTIAFERKVTGYKKRIEKQEAARNHTLFWKTKFSKEDVIQGIEIATAKESSFFRFFSGAWKALKAQVDNSYDFSKHQVKPRYKHVLEQLLAEYSAVEAVSDNAKEIEQQYHLTDLQTMYAFIELIRTKKDTAEIQYVLHAANSTALVKDLSKLAGVFSQLEPVLQQALSSYTHTTIGKLQDELESIQINTEVLSELLPSLKAFTAIDPQVKRMLKTLPVTPREAQASMANKTFNHISLENKTFAVTDYSAVEKAVHAIQVLYKQLLKQNADLIRASIRKNFLDHLDLSNMALSQLTSEQKTFKKQYSEGRKILENEFAKSMRYKSIRELSEKESGEVLRDLKPVWLMSPLSVSDSLPLQVACFDAIIFDEASQITLEEGIPSLYRAPQIIIVGDDKQMPPSNFFTAKAEDPDDLDESTAEENDELLSNDADSLLAQGARKLDSVMLGWHYRSRYETLISFSNHAFYNAGLLTIPDKTIHHQEKQAIVVQKAEEGTQHASALFDRSISYHFLQDGLYEKRANLDEADYIAHMVREILNRNVPESIGIVAFSQEQQHAIEDALTRLASTDKNFESRLEAAYTRTEEDQFIGLFVKNLENVQGDERDIIIMSVCYGFDRKKKMIMNFGPINKKGGEKRLNVIFSRAKKHMAIVSSIKHFNIKNEYNAGANYFKKFLHYAELISEGNTATARTILDGLVRDNKQKTFAPGKNSVLEQIKQALEKEGYEVAAYVGQSSFKCSLAVKAKKEDTEYTLGILLDDDLHYSNENLMEQYFQRPAVLQSFGWRTITLFAKDWFQHPDRVLQQLIKRIKEVPVPTVTEIEPDAVQTAEEPKDAAVPASVQSEEPVKKAELPSVYGDLLFTELIYKDETSHKFWKVAFEHTSNKLVICFGRAGTKGQTQVKTFASAELAEKEKEKMIREKQNKGYVNV